MGRIQIKENRNYGIDLLRIVAMYMIVVLHVLGYGGLLGVSYHPGQYGVSWMLEIASLCAVNCYALISGYVGVDGGYRYSSIAVLWLRVLFYSAGIAALFCIFAPELITRPDVVKAVFPVMSRQYWYFTAYFCMFFFIPIINKAIDSISLKQFKTVTVTLIAVFSVLQTLFVREAFGTSYGYSGWWLLIMYIIGAYLKKADSFNRMKASYGFVLYLLCVMISWTPKVLLKGVTINFMGEVMCENIFTNYTSPTMVGAAVFLFIGFKQLDIHRIVKKGVAVVSPLAFSVYLIHINPLVRDNILMSCFSQQAVLEPLKLALFVIAVALLICICCYAIDSVRHIIFKVLKINELCGTVEKRIIGEVWIKK